MPVYEYECAKCEKVTEALRPMADADAAITCEHCGDQSMTRKHSVFMAGATSTDSRPTLGSPGSPGSPGGGGCCGGGCGCNH